MSENDPDSFEKWSARQDWKTRITVLIVILLALIGAAFLLERLLPCKVSEGCYSTDDPPDP
jgi:hypothetical protein